MTDARYQVWADEWLRNKAAAVHIVGMETAPLEDRLPVVAHGRCREASEAMCAAFPELRLVRGHFGYCPHWWCEAPDGAIVDPTVIQFNGATADYREYHGPDPIGKCMNCGEYVWDKTFMGACCQECLVELVGS